LSRASFKKVLLFFTAIISGFWFMDLSVVSDGAEISSYWVGFSVIKEWSWLAMLGLMTVTILYVITPFLKIKTFSPEWWIYLAWLTAASISVLFVSIVYLAAGRCDYTIYELFSSIPSAWTWSWSIAMSLMLPIIITGIVLGDRKISGKTRWDIAEKIVMGIASLWSCYLSTFGITIWNMVSFCQK
jgi:hypothetical protein